MIRRNNTPTPTLATVGRSASTTSTTSSVYPSRTGVHWKPKCDDTIPSDDSDPGDKAGVKPRTRVRKNVIKRLAHPGGMSSLMSQPASRPDTVSKHPAASRSQSVTSKNLSIKKALFQPTSGSSNEQIKKSSNHIHPVPETTSGHGGESSRKNQGTTEVADQREASTSKKTSRDVSRSSSVSRTDSNQNKLCDEWMICSVWFAAWDIIWKCNHRKTPLSKNKEFRKFITRIYVCNTSLQNSFDMNVLRVKRVNDGDDSFKIDGKLEKRPDYDIKPVKWIPYPKILQQFLKKVTTCGDIIVQCIPRCDATGKLNGKAFTVHLTPKDEEELYSCSFSDICGAKVTISNVDYEHYSPLLALCKPVASTGYRLCQREANKPSTSQDKPKENGGSPRAHSSKSLQSPLVMQSRSASTTSSSNTQPNVRSSSSRIENPSTNDPPRDIEATDNKIDSSAPQCQTSTPAQPSEENMIDDIEMEIDDDSDDCDDGPSSPTENVQISYPNPRIATSNFDIASFMKTGRFVPGPLRPKTKKTEKNVYVYNTLAELASMLNDSINEDKQRGIVPNMMIKHQCHLYALVVNVLQQLRHVNAYFLRVSDESRDSVLVRIHPNHPTSSVIGLEIQVGNIIRIHRLTVQEEWDSEVSENRMVLSTSSHLNYTLFEKSNDVNEFNYNSCAKTITLTGYDYKRVGELYEFKTNPPINCNSQVSEIEEQPSIITDGDCDSNDQLNPVAAHECNLPNLPASPVGKTRHQETPENSEGICNSDLDLPPLTDADRLTPYNSEPNVPLDECSDRVVRSDESFVSASSHVHQDLNIQAAKSTQDSFHKSASQQKKPPEVMMETAITSSNRFLNIKDLVKTNNDPVNLVFKIVCFCGSKKDVEHAVPPPEFLILDSTSNPIHQDCTVLTITNGEMLEDREMLYAEQGDEDEIYSVRNVEIKGVKPPYQLVVDGKVCKIEKYGIKKT